MQTHPRSLKSLVSRAALATALCALGGVAVASYAATRNDTLAQRLVRQEMAAHPDATEIGINVRLRHGCHSIASSDPGDVGESCESGDLRVMRTHRPYAVKESDGYDVSVPLRDAAGKMIGSLAVEFRLVPGETRSAMIARAERIGHDMAAKIPSRASLER